MLTLKMPESYFTPDWPAPIKVKSLSTTRIGGVSTSPYSSLNLATHVGDNPIHVAHNRQKISSIAHLPEQPRWLEQTHGTRVLESHEWQLNINADAMYSCQPQHVCTVMTADCLPVLVCNKQGTYVAAIHAGWRGLADGIIEKTIQTYQGNNDDLLIWLGPAIGAQQFEVGHDVLDYFTQQGFDTSQSFIPSTKGHYLADIYGLARQHIARSGVENIYGGDLCTVSEPNEFFSYRREGITGRMASMIWIDTK